MGKKEHRNKSTIAEKILRLALFTSMLFGCVPIEATVTTQAPETSPLPTDEITHTPTLSPTEVPVELTQTIENPATKELTLVSPTDVATGIPTGFIKIDMDNITYPPVGFVKENFEKGEYDAGVETIKQWVGVWEKMGVFEGLEIENNSLSPVPLDGRARIVCVRANEEAPLLCPPLDLINGGLKAVPEEGNWDETDMPLMVSLERLEELISRGSETDMAYQFIDKYQKFSIKYIDPKTGQNVEGEYQVPGGEIKLPEIVPESMNQIEELSFNMEFKDPKAAYRMLLETVVGDNLENQKFWQETLGTSNPTVDQLLAFARNNVGGPENKAYWLPFNTDNGTKFNFLSVMGTQLDLRMIKPKIDGVYVDGIYSIFFYGKDLNDFVVYNFINKIKRDNLEIFMGPIHVVSSGITYEEFGLLFFDNRFIYLSGDEGKNFGPNVEFLLGGGEDVYRPECDPAIISAQFLSYLDAMADYNPNINSGTKGQVCTIDPEICKGGIFSGNLSPEDWVVKSK